MTVNKKLSLSEFQLLIRDVLYTSLPESYWVVAEISEIKENHAGHAYLELVEKQEDDVKIRALSKSSYWLRLVHYEKGIFGGYKSTADGEAFFFSPLGIPFNFLFDNFCYIYHQR